MSFPQNERGAIVKECDRQAIDNRQRAVRLARPALESFLRRAKSELGLREADLTVRLVSDAEIARMNETFRKKIGPTDVLSFPAVARRRPRRPASEGGPYKRMRAGQYLGDIAISPATARRYAKKNGRKLSRELQVLILHGVLHLLGYDHETDRGEMERVERKLRKRLGLA
ncbi:MAG TPA: rRNA maturation RNase YbeY [Candidatus Cybelea sp.]|nr:rRNA maturation RNase YbeY [Candidatus Cybelea sp.]